MLDMWTDVLRRQAGERPALKPPISLSLRRDGGKDPRGVFRIAAPTAYVWIIGRTKTDGPADYDAVHEIQAGYKVTPVSRWGKAPEPVTVITDPAVDMKTPPMVQVDTMAVGADFAYAAELLKLHAPHPTDQPIIAQMKQIGLEAGKSFDFDELDPLVKQVLETAPEAAQQLMKWKVPTVARVAHYWSMNTDTMGVYGNYYIKRAIVAQLGLGANLPEDAIYPLNLADEMESRSTGRTNTRFTLRRAPLPRCVRSGPLHCMTRRVSRLRIHESVCREQLDAVQVQRGRFARPLLSKR